jgi:hypothetical protein
MEFSSQTDGRVKNAMKDGWHNDGRRIMVVGRQQRRGVSE